MSKVLHRGLEAKLAALKDPEWDSSDEEELPSNGGKDEAVKTKKTGSTKTKTQKDRNGDKQQQGSRVIYLGHIPPAFEETQILEFLSQFGNITNLKLSRSKRTGNSRGYGFVEFQEKDVAAIVANTMSGYFLLGERRLVCHVVPQDKIHPNLFSSSKRNLLANKIGNSDSRIQYWQNKNREQVNGTKSADSLKKITERLLNRENAKRKKLAKLGIEYDFPGYAASVEKEKEEEMPVADVIQTPSKKTKPKKAGTEVKKVKKSKSKRRRSHA